MKFLDVKTDYAFKKVFGNVKHKNILISFLNEILDFEGDGRIKDLTIVDPYNIPMLKGMKDTFVDVKAILNDGSKVIIEMQVLNHQGFEKRVLYNAAKNYSTQLIKGENYRLLNPVIALSIVDFDMFLETDKMINRFKLLSKESLIDYSDDIELIFVELPKFKKDLKDLKDIKEQWIYFIQNAGSLEYVPNEFDEPIQEALGIVNEANMNVDELELQYKRLEFISIQKLAFLKASNDGLAQGLEQGLEQGKSEGIEFVAKNLKKQGLKIDQIVIATGLTVKEIDKL